MHAQRPAQPSDHDEQVDELRPGREELGELVNDYEQRGHRREAGFLGRLGVVAHRGVVARRAQQLLPADQLAVQCVAHPIHQRKLVGQVGDDRGYVGQLVQSEEGRAALEVDQNEIEHIGGMGEG